MGSGVFMRVNRQQRSGASAVGMAGSRRLPIGVGLLMMGLAGVTSPARAADPEISAGLGDIASFANIGKGFQVLSVVGQTQGTASASFHNDDIEVHTGKRHLAHIFKRHDSDGNTLISPYLEGTLGRGKSGQTIGYADGGPDDFRLDLKYRSHLYVIGAGAAIPLGPNTRLIGLGFVGRSRFKINSVYTGAAAADYYDAYDGLLNNGRINSTIIGPAAQIDHRSMIAKDIYLTLSSRYTHFFDISDHVSNKGLKPRGSTGIGTISANVEVPTKVYLGEREFFAGVFTRGTILTGAKSSQFGFQRFAELGGSLQLDFPSKAGLGIGVHGSFIRGAHVKGHTIGLSLTFDRFALLKVH